MCIVYIARMDEWKAIKVALYIHVSLRMLLCIRAGEVAS
jgi:hypothetical protein